jgi:hypothetical protein
MVTLVRVLAELFLGELLSFGVRLEPSEEESIGRQVEESVLRLLAILVHRVADNIEVDQRVLQEVIVLVVSM